MRWVVKCVPIKLELEEYCQNCRNFEAKTIKHSFKTFPTVKLGNFSKIQEDEAQAIDYGLDEEIVIPKEVQVLDKAENDLFGGAPIEQAETVTVAEDDGIF